MVYYLGNEDSEQSARKNKVCHREICPKEAGKNHGKRCVLQCQPDGSGTEHTARQPKSRELPARADGANTKKARVSDLLNNLVELGGRQACMQL